MLDRPLQAFHVSINQAVRSGGRALTDLNDSSGVRYLKSYFRQAPGVRKQESGQTGT